MRRVMVFALLCTLGCSSRERILQSAAPDEIDWAAEGSGTVKLLQDLIRIDTINPPPPESGKVNANETVLLERVSLLLAKDGIDARVFESAPGRGNLVARLKGTGKKRPLLIMAHADVVSVEPKMWSVGPLSALEKDGFIWGRGALDDKGWAACAIQTLRLLVRRGPRLDRDVILMLNADEESGGSFGAKFMVEKHPDLLECEFVLNEGGRTALKDGKIVSVGVQCAEKIYNDFRLWIRGVSGHSSVPVRTNAIYEISELLAKLRDFQSPIRILPTPAAWLEVGCNSPAYAGNRDLMKAAAKGDLEAAGRLAEIPEFNAQLRSTVVPTLIRGGIRENVLPPDVEVNFNARLLPGTKLEDLIRDMAAHVGLENCDLVEIKPGEIADWKAKHPEKRMAFFITDRDPETPSSPLETPIFAAIREVSRELAPGAVVIPQMSAGASDSQFFRARGVACYGIHPCPTSDEERATMHNHNERVRSESVRWGVKFLYRVVVEICK